MPVTPRPEVIGPGDLIEADPNTRAILEQLVNTLCQHLRPLRVQTQGGLDNLLITALVTYAGHIHGELAAMGMVHDATGEATDRLLRANWKAGHEAGKHAVVTKAAELGMDPTS